MDTATKTGIDTEKAASKKEQFKEQQRLQET